MSKSFSSNLLPGPLRSYSARGLGSSTIVSVRSHVISSNRAASSSSSDSRPALPQGRLPKESLRKLVQLHHMGSTFITPETLDPSLDKVIADHDGIERAGDRELRALAQARIKTKMEKELGSNGGSADEKEWPLSEMLPSWDVIGQSSSISKEMQNYDVAPTKVKLLGYTNGQADTPRRVIVDQHRSWSDPRAEHFDEPSNVSHILTDRERQVRDALFGTVSLAKSTVQDAKSKPGLEAVLEYVGANPEK